MPLLTMPGHLIRRLQQKSTAIFQARMNTLGNDFTSVQFAAMHTLAAHPGIEQAQLAELIAYDRATIGGVLDRLERKAYINRTVSKLDRRAREVRLTTLGTQVLDELSPHIESLQQEILAELTSAEQQQFLTLAHKVVASKAPSEKLPQ